MRHLAVVVCFVACRAAASPAPTASRGQSSTDAAPARPLARTFDVGIRGSLTLGQRRALADGAVTHPRGPSRDCLGRCPDTVVTFAPPLPDSLSALNVVLDSAGRITELVGVYEPTQPLVKVRAAWERRLGLPPCLVARQHLIWRDAATLVRILADSAGNVRFWEVADISSTNVADSLGYRCR